jgi:hypothetical protein
MSVYLNEIYLILPATSLAVGIFTGLLEQQNRWWLAGVSLLPLMASMLYASFDGGVVILACIYLSLSLLSAWLVSLYRERRKARNRF